jgi:hypothetical protein
MNSGGEFPWANRRGSNSIRPLPDDVRFLRDLYSAAGTRSEVAVLNTWWDSAAAVTQGSRPQEFNCAPSLGTTDSVQFNAGFCGTGGPASGSTDVCPNDILRSRFTIANYSTSAVDLEARIYLSPNRIWDVQDWVSVTSRPISIVQSDSGNFARTWRVPNAEWGFYNVIVRVTGVTTTGDPVEDWMPLPGSVFMGTCDGQVDGAPVPSDSAVPLDRDHRFLP